MNGKKMLETNLDCGRVPELCIKEIAVRAREISDIRIKDEWIGTCAHIDGTNN